MNFYNRVKDFFVSEAEQCIYGKIPNDHVWPKIDQEVLEPDESYLRIWLNDMYLAHKRVLYQTRCPLVHAICRFNYASSQRDLRLVVGQGQSENLGSALDRMVNLNYPLLGPVPYTGGDVELLMALVAMEVTDYGNQLLDVLGILSQLTGRGELKAALPFLHPLKKGAEGLFGMKGLKAHLVMHDTFSSGNSSPNRLTSGYRVVMDKTEERIDPGTLWVRDGRLCSGPELESAKPFKGSDYFLFYLERVSVRGDDIPSIREAWDTAIEKAVQSNDQEVDLALSAFKETVLKSPDLIWNDREKWIISLIDKVKAIQVLKERRAFLSNQLDTSLASAVADQLEPAGRGSNITQRLSREDLIRLNWR